MKLEVFDIIPDLKEQIGYKLYWLLKLRALIPATTPEILMGDDSEADFVVYNLYYRFMNGDLDAESLQVEFQGVNVAESWLASIDALAKSPDLSGNAAPLAIYINRTDATGDSFDIEDWKIPGITRYHRGAWPLALDMAEEGWLDDDAVNQTWHTLLDEGSTPDQLDANAMTSCFRLELLTLRVLSSLREYRWEHGSPRTCGYPRRAFLRG